MASKPQQRVRAPRLSMGAWFLVAILLLLALFLALIELSRPHVDGTRFRVDEFLTVVDEGRVRDAKILDADGIVVGSAALAAAEEGASGLERFVASLRAAIN